MAEAKVNLLTIKKERYRYNWQKVFTKNIKILQKNITYQDYPIKDHEPMLLIDKIHELEAKED